MDWGDFEHLSYDSRDVTPSSLFFAKGAAFKREFLENAVKLAWASTYRKDYQVGNPCHYCFRYQQAMSPRCSGLLPYPQDKLKLLALLGQRENNDGLLCL